MNKKQVLKKLIRNTVKLPGLHRLKPITDSVLRKNGIKEEAVFLQGCSEPVVIFGVNRLSMYFCRLLLSKGTETYLIPLDNENVPDELSEKIMQTEDLLYMKERNPHFYSMAPSRDGVVKSRLLELGFRPQSVKRLGYGTFARIRGVRLSDSRDPLLGSVRTKDSELPGYSIFQNGKRSEALRIMVLGGSTSDPTLMNLKSWSEYLADALTDMNISFIIFNGAVGGYTSSQEMKKMIRDITILQPQLIISLSGVNDAAGIYSEPGHPLYQREDFYETKLLVRKGLAKNELQSSVPLKDVSLGPNDSRSLFNVWLDNERCMHAVALEFGAEFHAFLQPIREINSVKTDFYREAKQYFAHNHYNWLHDYSRLLDGDKSVYADFCHVYEKGNRVICRKILRYVMEHSDLSNKTGSADSSFL